MHHGPEPETEPLTVLRRAQRGDAAAREEFIKANHAFIVQCVLQQVPVQTAITATDEYSVALIAFNEAVDRYDESRGASFHGFARQVIRRRLVDHYRAGRRFAPEVPHAEPPEERTQAEPAFPVEEAREEIERLAARLAEFGFGFADLVRETPKHRDSRLIAVGIARRILADPAMRDSLERKKKLPFKVLLQRLAFNPKTVQRHRRYIIAVCVILSGGFPLLQDYVRGLEEGGAPGER